MFENAEIRKVFRSTRDFVTLNSSCYIGESDLWLPVRNSKGELCATFVRWYADMILDAGKEFSEKHKQLFNQVMKLIKEVGISSTDLKSRKSLELLEKLDIDRHGMVTSYDTLINLKFRLMLWMFDEIRSTLKLSERSSMLYLIEGSTTRARFGILKEPAIYTFGLLKELQFHGLTARFCNLSLYEHGHRRIA
ncbi:hypothetical protein C4561_01775 [candidate division WWE3 bacterium]|uniref:Uncharacterized protein n=1 Tax=candidate division WWE3 bacterium TaxID=2053526 RepID=A0A3A4ZF62_UNCKA|nr:MAG: hypothetical protein C4561_01775 [candidate division WWE3 bacterium]